MTREVTVDVLQQRRGAPTPLLLIDVRRPEDVAADPSPIPGADWRDPERVADWAPRLPRDADIVIYCVRGGSVSNRVLDELLQQGRKAQLLEGGLDAWKRAGSPVQAQSS